MGRLHTHNHGKSHSTRPIILKKPSWMTQKPEEIQDLITKYGNQHSIPLVKPIINKGITEVLAENNLNTELPEDLQNIVNKSIGLQKHLRTHKSDHRNVRSLELIEAKVHRLSVYYKRKGLIPKNWKYKSVVAQLE